LAAVCGLVFMGVLALADFAAVLGVAVLLAAGDLLVFLRAAAFLGATLVDLPLVAVCLGAAFLAAAAGLVWLFLVPVFLAEVDSSKLSFPMGAPLE